MALLGSDRINGFFAAVLAELRLASAAVGDLRALHRPFVRRNEHLATLVVARDVDAALTALTEYLADSERILREQAA